MKSFSIKSTAFFSFFYIFILTIVCSGLLYFIQNIRFLGKNIFLFIPFLILIMITLFMLTSRNKYRNILLSCFFLILFGLSFVALMHYADYSQSLGLFQARTTLTFLFAISFWLFSNRYLDLNQRSYLLISIILTVSIIQLSAYYFIPGIQVIRAPFEEAKIIFDGEKTREGLLGAPFTAYHCVVGMLLLLKREKKTVIEVLCFLVFAITILSSLTRVAILFMVLIFLFSIKEIFFKKVFLIMIPFLIYFLILVNNSDLNLLDQIINRMDNISLNSSRIDKNLLAVDMSLRSFGFFLWGVPDIISRKSVNNITISDNSFFLIQLKFGFIMTFIWISTTIYLIKKNSSPDTLGWLWFLISLSITNSILWDSYIFCLTGFMLMNPRNERNKIISL